MCGHPGLAAEVYDLRVDMPGAYRVKTVSDELCRRRQIIVLREGCSGTLAPGRPGVLMTNQSAGGLVIGEHRHFMGLQQVLEEEADTDGYEIWNQVAEGFFDQIASLPVGPEKVQTLFAMICGDDWFLARPLLENGALCGYSILCHCTHEGVQTDVKPHLWEEVEARGELPSRVNAKGFTKCPHCDLSFKTTSASWNGFRHTRCWGRIRLVPDESAVT